MTSLVPTCEEIKALFEEEVAARSGKVINAFADRQRLFLRATILPTEEVLPDDRVQAGLALRTCGQQVFVHPYVFRLVCRNGQIMARVTDTCVVDRLEPDVSPYDFDLAEHAIRDAIGRSVSDDVFANAVDRMRSATEHEADLAIMMMSALPHSLPPQVLGSILDRFTNSGDRSAYGLVNAVTAIARDTRDHETRWRLEELGGGIPARLGPAQPIVQPSAQRSSASE